MNIEAIRGFDRQIPPVIKEWDHFAIELPACSKHKLSNGVEVALLEVGDAEVVQIQLLYDAGKMHEAKRGIGQATISLLRNGTSSRSAYDISSLFLQYAARLSTQCGGVRSAIVLSCLNKHATKLLPMLAELLSDSIFPDQELELYARRVSQRLQLNLQDTDVVAAELTDAALYGEDHPYGIADSRINFAALCSEDCRSFFKQYIESGACKILVSGKPAPDFLHLLDSSIGKLPIHAPVIDPVKQLVEISPSGDKKQQKIINPNGVQASIRITKNFPNHHHADYPRMEFLSVILGGYFGSRLISNLRESNGYTYNISSYVMSYSKVGSFGIATDVGREISHAALGEIYKEMKILRETRVGERELQDVRNYYIGALLSILDGPLNIISQWRHLFTFGLDETHFDRRVITAKTITAKDIQEMAEKYLDPESFYEIVVI